MPFSVHDLPEPYDDITADYVGNFIVVCQSNIVSEKSSIIVFDHDHVEVKRFLVECYVRCIYSLTDDVMVCVCTRQAGNSLLVYDFARNESFITDALFLPGRLFFLRFGNHFLFFNDRQVAGFEYDTAGPALSRCLYLPSSHDARVWDVCVRDVISSANARGGKGGYLASRSSGDTLISKITLEEAGLRSEPVACLPRIMRTDFFPTRDLVLVARDGRKEITVIGGGGVSTIGLRVPGQNVICVDSKEDHLCVYTHEKGALKTITMKTTEGAAPGKAVSHGLSSKTFASFGRLCVIFDERMGYQVVDITREFYIPLSLSPDKPYEQLECIRI